MSKRNRLVDSVVTGAFAYALMLGWSACIGGSSGSGGFVPDGGGSGATGSGGQSSIIPDALAEQSGSRLKARRMHGADGSSQFESWIDTARGGEPCGFTPTIDGKSHCLPTGPLRQNASSGYFADPDCTVPVARVDPSCQPPIYILVAPSDDQTKYCSGAYKIASVHKAVMVNALYQSSSTYGCEVSSSSSDQVNYAAADEIPLSDFVEGQESVDP